MIKIKTKHKIIYNFIDGNVIEKIGERMRIFSEEIGSIMLIPDLDKEKI
jgi:hypothetical protein